MMTPLAIVSTNQSVQRYHRLRAAGAACLTLTMLLLFASGCRTAAMRAANLPLQYQARMSSRPNNIDLSRIASPSTSESIIAPSDLLEITLMAGRNEEEVTPFLARVSNDGTVDIPVVGTVMVAGKEVSQAGHEVTEAAIARGMYLHPIVTMEIKSKAINRITVLGAVNEPGDHELPRGSSDLVSALAKAGGLTPEAGTEVEIVRQPQPQVFLSENQQQNPAPQELPEKSEEIQLAAYQALGSAQNETARLGASSYSPPQTLRFDLADQNPTWGTDFRLHDRDVVRVVQRKEEMIHVDGLVMKPGQYTLPLDQDVHLLDALAMAGGRSLPVADKVLIIRRMDNQAEPITIQASIFQAKRNGHENIRLAPGDTVTIEQTPSTVVVGTLYKFFRLTMGVASNTVF